MEIDITQKKLSVRDKYRIYLNGEEKLYASSEMFSFLARMHLYDLGSDFPRVSMQQQWAWFKTTYTLKFEGGSATKFTTQSFWKRHYQCYVGGSAYDIYGHTGRKFSIYKDDTQIAWWDKKAVSWFNGDNYHLLADDNADIDLLISFCLIIDRQQSNRKGGRGLHIDVGSFGPQAREFDPHWQPKSGPDHARFYKL